MTTQQVTIEDIDLGKQRVLVAFLREYERSVSRSSAAVVPVEEDAAFEAQFDIEAAADALPATQREWHGVFDGIYEAVREAMVRSYTTSRHFSHCELCFSCSPHGEARFGEGFIIACGTRADAGVKIVARAFNDRYKWLSLRVSDDELERIVRFVFAQRGKPYDARASYQVFTVPRPTFGARWYCSELVLCALQMLPCAVLHSRRANCVEVDEVYALVGESSRCVKFASEISEYYLNKQSPAHINIFSTSNE